jgi:ubiquinone biosynthesis monooxygenase Coq7
MFRTPWNSQANIHQIARVDHAGEYGAIRIYAGQKFVFSAKRPDLTAIIEHMEKQEHEHWHYFHSLLPKRQIRPSILMPLWHVAGFALGAVTARMGEKEAMACTVAVETVINDHYEQQRKLLSSCYKEEKELIDRITQFQLEEMEHHAIGIEHHATEAPTYPLLYKIISAGSRLAIYLAKRF